MSTSFPQYAYIISESYTYHPPIYGFRACGQFQPGSVPPDRDSYLGPAIEVPDSLRAMPLSIAPPHFILARFGRPISRFVLCVGRETVDGALTY